MRMSVVTWRNSMYSSEWNLVMSGMLAMYGRNTWHTVSRAEGLHSYEIAE